ncbi:MAG: ORF6N domain-containing protein [Hyphomicrobium sp.]
MGTKVAKRAESSPIRIAVIEVRGERVVIDEEVARLFGTETKKLNQQVSRNKEKFGEDFSFSMTKEEFDNLRSQNVTSSSDWGGRRYPPRVFTEHGVVMAATIVKTPDAIQATRHIVRVFVEANREAWEQEHIRKRGGQLPLSLDVPLRQSLGTKLHMALGHVLDEIIDPKENKTVRDEAREVAAQGLTALKDYLKKVGVENERTLAEVQRMMAEAESIKAETARKHTENKHRQLALLAKQLRLIIQAQHYAETGSFEGLVAVLSDLEKD